MVETCPHCYATVLFKPDGTCPSCGKARTDTEGVDPTITSVDVREIDPLPSLCVSCGTSTDRHTRLRRSRPLPGSEDGGAGLVVLLVLRPLAWLLWKAFSRRSQTITIPVPQCPACATREIRVRSVNYEDGYLSLLVNVEFARALGRMREQRD